MASPLGLTNFNNVFYTADQGDPTLTTFTGKYNSLFNGSKFYHRPNISTTETSETVTNPNGEKVERVNRSDSAQGTKKHQPDTSSDDLYDISTNSILEYTENPDLPAIKLKAADFAYLRELGVYPNNRLIVCRRFTSPVENDLTAIQQEPLSTVVSWIPDSEDSFFSFKSSENWISYDTEDPLKDLTDLFNKIFSKATGIDIGKEGGGMLSGIASKLPVGGLGEAIQTKINNILLGNGTSEGTNFSYDNLPQGNPNFMAESSFRESNSIKSEISIPVKAVYEMKYINGIDPTIAFMDVIQNLLRFSSSQSVFYISQAGGEKINNFFTQWKNGQWIKAIQVILNSIIDTVKQIIEGVGDFISRVKDTLTGNGDLNFDEALRSVTSFIGSASIARYRIEFAKIIPAATGANSAPWHVTIGNPKKPFFSSGDMIVEAGEVKMGNTLGFNDIPTKIEFNFTIRSARNLGIQEIFDKFNVGAGRQYQRGAIEFRTDFYQGSVNKTGGGTSSNPATGASA